MREFKTEIEQPSDFWDQFIERMSEAALKGELAYGGDRPIQNHERNLRFMASEPRLKRAMLARAMLQKIASTPKNMRTSFVMESHNPKVWFVFLLQEKPRGSTEHSYRLIRQGMLDAYCMVVKLLWPQADFVYAIGMQSGNLKQQSEDLVSFDFREWTDADTKTAIELREEFNILTEGVTRHVLTSEANTTRFEASKGNRKERRKAKAEARRK